MTDPVKSVGFEGPGATNGPVDRKRLDDLFQQQKDFARTVRHCRAEVRTKKLHRLQQALLERRTGLQEAMWSDFGKAPEEVDLTEVTPVVLEARHAIRHLDKWMRPRKVRMPLLPGLPSLYQRSFAVAANDTVSSTSS